MFELPQELIGFWVFAFGAIVGSFLNVVIFRVPLRRSIVRPGSACPACGVPIRWYDNVPIVSWLILRARCRDCNNPISIRYPLVEAAAGVLAVLAVHTWGLNIAGAEALVFSWICLVLALVDYDHQILPDVITYPTILLGIGASFMGGVTWWLDSLLGAVMGAALPIAVIVLYKLIRGEEGMGWGDVKFLAGIGAVLGLAACLWVLIVAAILGAIVGAGLMISGRGTSKTALPFGTFLAFAALIYLYLPPAWRLWPSVALL
ncbi:MAG: A24 family peptidase [Thermoanaerobaculales bacterium]|nr:A24 family peptidase [Thermoanaerobaculales bacterium]